VCGFLLAFHGNYGYVLHHLQDRARYWSKIVIFSYLLALDAPVRGFPSECWHPVWFWKTRMVGLPDGEKTLGYMQPFRHNTGVWRTDRWMDGHTSCHGIVRAMRTRRAVKIDVSPSQPLGTPIFKPKNVHNLRKTNSRYQKAGYGPDFWSKLNRKRRTRTKSH